MGNLDSFDATSRHLANESGQAVFSVEYRLAPENPFPAALEDAWAATHWVVNNASALRVDMTKIAVLGESAGGNLAAAVCLIARDLGVSSIGLQVLVYASVDARLGIESLSQYSEGYLQTTRDVHHAFKTYGLGSTASAEDWRISPLLAQSHEGLPAALLISAGCDGVRDDSFAYTTKLLEAGVPAIHVCYPGMVHTFFGMRGLVPDAEHAQKLVAAAIREAIG
jgi:acetyl esterase